MVQDVQRKKDFVSKNKNANCIFLKKYNSENSQEGPKSTRSSQKL